MVIESRKLTVGIPGHWGTVMPPLQHSAFGFAVIVNQFEPLVRRGKNGVIEPLAARAWEADRDFRVLRFSIDTDRRFSDGSTLTAQDFKRSWEDGLRMDPKSLNKSVADALFNVKGFADLGQRGTIEGIRVLGKDLLEVEFDRPVRMAVEYLAGARFAAY